MEKKYFTSQTPLTEQIEKFKKHTLNRTDTFALDRLNPLLTSVGYTNKTLTLDQTHMKYCLFNSYNGTENEKANHFTGEEFFTSLPSLLAHPIAIIPSNTMGNQRQLIILDYKLNGSYVCLSVRGDGQGRKDNQAFPSTHVFSICAKEKAEYILSCRINEELEHQKYVNKPCGVYYIDKEKATEMLNGKGFELPRAFNLNGLISNIQGQSLVVKENVQKSEEKSQNLRFTEESAVESQNNTQNHKTTNFVISENTENVAPTTTTATVEETAPTVVEDTTSTTQSFLSLTSDELHALSESIRKKTDFVISNPNLDKPFHLTWGSMGDITKTLHGIGGYGLEHFIQRRYESDKKNVDELTAAILLIAQAMKTATPTMHEESATKRNLIVSGMKTIIDSVDKTKESNTELNYWKYISSMSSEKYEEIKKEGKVAIQTVIAQYGFTHDFSEIRNQVGALITSVNNIRQENPIVNDIYEKKSKKVIFVLGNVFREEEKERFNNEIEEIQNDTETNGEKVKIINAYELAHAIENLSTMKFKQKNAVVINKLTSELKKGNITEIINISNSEKTKVETEIEGYATRHSISYSEKYERVSTPKEGITTSPEPKESTTNKQTEAESKTTKFEVLENHQIGDFTNESAVESQNNTQNHKTTNFVISEKSNNGTKTTEENVEEEKKGININDLTISERQAMNIREKVREILRKPDDAMTREDRAILRLYEGVGGLREEEATVEGALSEFYTPSPIVKKMWELMDAYHPDAYEVLEPSCGRGRFLDGRSDNHFTAYECDDTSARIAKILFPNADIKHDYFQSQFLNPSGRSVRKDLDRSGLEGYTLPDNDENYKQYDLVIGNPPYGKTYDKFDAFNLYYHVQDSSTYPDYFIKEGLANLKVGGLLAFIVPSSLQNKIKEDGNYLTSKRDDDYYKDINSLLELSSSSRLTIAFINSRLVDAYRLPEGMFPSTKIGTDILIFKKENIKDRWYIQNLRENYEKSKEEADLFLRNVLDAGNFFENHPDHVLGVKKERIGRHGKEETYIDFKDGENKEDVINKITPIKELVRERTREIIEGKYKIDQDTGEVEKEPVIIKPAKAPTWAKAETGHTMSEEEFAKKYGIDKNFSPEDKEIWKATKYDGSIEKEKLLPSTLSYLRNEKGKYIEIEKDVFYLKALYVTGNVYNKIDDLEKKKQSGLIEDKYYSECKRVLTENIPEKIKMEDIHFSPLTQFARDFKVKREIEIVEQIEHEIGERYGYAIGRKYKVHAHEQTYITQSVEMSLRKAFVYWALNTNNRYPEIVDYDETLANVKPEDFKTENNIIRWQHVLDYLKGVSVTDNISKYDTAIERKDKRQKAQSFKQDRRDVAERLFDKFIHEGLTDDEKARLDENYNKIFNAVVEPDYNKLPLYVSGMHTHKRSDDKDKEFTMHPVQLRGASFLSAKGSGLLAYDVGVGKTTTGIVATVMQMQSGRAKRPLIIVPKAVYKKWWEDLHQHFPDIEVNDLGNLDESHQVNFMKADHSLDIKEGTISLITYNGFTDHISFMDESLDNNGILSKDLQEILAINTSGTNRENSLELQKLNSRYGRVIKTSDENYAFFEKTGFDHITVDEAHNFKKLFTIPRTEHGESVEYKELSQPGEPSVRALKLYSACQLVQAINNGRNVFLLTATPFTNHPFEVFSMLAFMGRQRLKELQVNSIKAFADKFALTKSDWGVNSTGNIDFMTSMKEWRNLKELQGVLHEYFDRVTAEDAGIKRPNKIVLSPTLNITPLQKAINNENEERIVYGTKKGDAMKNKGEILKAINDMRKSILSPALVYGDYTFPIPSLNEFVEVSPKVKLCLDTVIKVYKRYPQGGQVIYCNLKDGLHSMKEYLIKNGVPSKAIEIFEGSTASNADKRQNKIDSFNNPENPLKIIMGTSTIKEGVDLNGNSVALWNLTLDWNPSDITQVEGRVWRQGNKQSNVSIIYPLTYNSIDAFMYQKYDEKSSRINELFSYKGASLKVEDINPIEMKYSLITDPYKRSKLIIEDKDKAIQMAISIYQSEKEKYQKLIIDLGQEAELKATYENDKNTYERRDKNNKDINVLNEYINLKNKITKEKRRLDKLQKAKEHLKTYSIEEAQKNIDDINARIEAKNKESADIHRDKEKIIEQVKEEIAKTKAPTKTVEEYSEEVASQIINNANLSIKTLHSGHKQVLETSEEKEVITSTPDKEKLETTNSVTPDIKQEEQKDKEANKPLTLNEAIQRYGLVYSKKQMETNKEQLFLAFLIAKKDEIYEGNKEIGLALYNRLRDSGVNIHLINDKTISILENNLKEKYGSIMEGSTVYGYEEYGKIYIDENKISANTLLHEYTHLWTYSIMRSAPIVWERIKQNIMNTSEFEEMYNDERYSDIKNNLDALVSETLSRITARNGVYSIEERLSKFKSNEDDESIMLALSDTYGWVSENVFSEAKHELNLSEITTRILGDFLNKKTQKQVKKSYYQLDGYLTNNFNKEKALEEGYKRLKDIMLEQFFSLRTKMSEELKEKYREHYDSLVNTSPKKACEILSRKIEENAVAYRFFDTILRKNYPDETFQNHILNCFKENSDEDFQSALQTGMKLDTVQGVLDTSRSNVYLHFVNLVSRDYFKNDNPIIKQILSDFVKSEGKEALRMLYIISGDNMDYKMKIRSLLPTLTYSDKKTGKTLTKAETYGILDYDKNMLLSSEYKTTYLDKPVKNIQSDLTLEERAITLSDEFQKAFRSDDVNNKKDKVLEWKEKYFISKKNEVRPYAIKLIEQGYTINSLYKQKEEFAEYDRLLKENNKTFEAFKEDKMDLDNDYEKNVGSITKPILNNKVSTPPQQTWRERQEQLNIERQKLKEEAEQNANKFYSWTANSQVPLNEPYLKEHGLDGALANENGVHYNLKFKSLQIPLYSNKTDKLVNLQTIRSERNEYGKWSKLFLKGSDTNVHATIGEKKSNIVFVAEGWATAGAISKATANSLTYASMSANNLKNTVEFAHNKHKDAFVIVVADNDRKQGYEERMGVGEEMAHKSGADLVITIPQQGQDAADYAKKNSLRKYIIDTLMQSKKYQNFLRKEQATTYNQQQNNEQTIQII